MIRRLSVPFWHSRCQSKYVVSPLVQHSRFPWGFPGGSDGRHLQTRATQRFLTFQAAHHNCTYSFLCSFKVTREDTSVIRHDRVPMRCYFQHRKERKNVFLKLYGMMYRMLRIWNLHPILFLTLSSTKNMIFVCFSCPVKTIFECQPGTRSSVNH